MAVELIKIGRVANDGTGDDLREAMLKINQNFEDLDLRSNEEITGANLGSQGEHIFSGKINNEMQFKRIATGDHIKLIADNEKIVIDTSDVVNKINVTADNGEYQLTDNAAISFIGGDGITTNLTSNGQLTIQNDYVSELFEDSSPKLSANLDANGFDILNANSISSSFVGNLTGKVNGVDPSVGAYYFENIDLGDFSSTVTNTIDLLLSALDVDMGTFGSPSAYEVDGGKF